MKLQAGKTFARHLGAAVLIVSFAGATHAQSEEDPVDVEPAPENALLTLDSDDYGVHEKHVERLTEAQRIAPIGVDAFGDRISYFTGGLSFGNVDISLPGNSGLPVELRRTFAIEDRRELQNGPSPKGHLGGFAEWDLDIPYLSGLFKASVGWQVAGTSPTQRCSNTSAPMEYATFSSFDYWNGYNLNIPGSGSEPMLHTPSAKLPAIPTGTYPWVTRSFWRFSCKTATANGYGGQAFIGHAPDGRKYHFDHVVTRTAPSLKYGGFPSTVPVFDVMTRESVFFLVTKVEDHHGNYVQYTYTGDKLTKIKGYASNGVADGREITLAWNGERIATATAPTGTWTYGYTGNTLTSVTRPDQSQWKYARTGRLFVRQDQPLGEDDPFNDCPENSSPHGDMVVYSVTHPAGATAAFTLAPTRHYRSNVPHQCVKPTTTYEYLQIPNYSDTFTLYRKAITGPGLTAMTWDYEYQGGHGLAFASNCTTPGSLLCPSVRKVTITGSAPVNTWEQHEYGILYGVDEGQLLSRKIGPTSASVLQTTTNTYMTSAEVASQPFPDLVGENPLLFSDQLGNRLRPLKRRVINQQGVDFIRETTDFDAFGASESDTVTGTATRTEATEYVHDLPRWIIGLPARHLVGGIETDRTVFDSLSRPWKRYRFGALESTFAYDTHGSLASVTDARGYTTTLSGWKWGIPQAIQFPIAGEALGVTVDHRGWITSVTDENGDTTGYGYDAMGRVATVTPPAGTGITFNPTTTAFVAVPSSEMGLTAGHWRQTTSRGDYRKITYFDALWRPVITHEYDAANQTDTQRFAGFRYDHGGRTTFAGNPRASATSIASFTAGTTTSNDALGRPTLVTQSSEHGNLSTTYAYLAGFQTRVTNPRTHSTLTAYQAFDTPGTDSPAEIIAAEGESEEQITTIVRDVFGKALSVTRAGEYAGAPVTLTRQYVYDPQQRLCKRFDPEAGQVGFAYDAAGNVLWSAQTSSLTEPQCDAVGATSAARIDYEHDPRNRLTKTDYVDVATPDITTTYFPNGAVASVAQGGVTLSYDYNELGALTQERLQHGSTDWLVQHAYTANGDRASLTYPNGLTVAFAPNALGQATQAGTYATGASYFPNGALKQFTYGNQIVHTLTQNIRGLPERSLDTYGANAVLDDTYDFDFNGNVAAISDGLTGAPGDRDMTYDALDRLVGVAAGAAQGGNAVYSYDPLDNVRVADQGARQYRYAYSTSNRLGNIKTPAGTTLFVFSYDGRGNQTARSGATFTWDRANRLTATSLGTSSYVYDGLGRRVQATAGGITTLSFYGHAGELFWQQTPTQKHAYVRLAGSLVAQLDYPAAGGAASVKYQHTDALGTPVAETDANRAVTRERMTSYGEPVDGTYSDGPGYTGHVTDAASKLTYMQQRYYDPVIGRFISADPLAADTAGANFNRYKYSANNPHTFYDPDGRLERTVGSRIPGGTAGRSVTGAAGVGELGRLRLSNRNAAGGYSTPDDAATAQFAAHESEYQETGSSEELLGAIAEKKIDGQVRYFFSTMIVVRAFSFKGALTVDMGTGFTRVALSHTHPGANGGQEFFSIDDAKFVGKIGSEKYPARMPYYLRTPLGDVRVLSPTTGGALRMQGGRLVNPEHRLPAYGNQDN